MLTIADAKAARPRARGYKLHDEGGLHLFIAPTGRKSWRMAFRWRGREQLLTIGRFPDLSIAQARARRDAARAQLADGADPRRVDIKVNTFARLARAWHAHNAASWSTAHATDALASLERDVLPGIGKQPINEIEPPELLRMLRAIERRGRIETARRVRQRLAEIFAYGIAEGLCSNNPAEHLGAALLEPPPARPQPALTDIDDCRQLLAACDRAPARTETRLASRFLALTAVRLDAVRGMRWNELEGLDGLDPIWIVPPARMKLKRAKKGEGRFAHIVPLSTAAVDVLRSAMRLSQNATDARSDNIRLSDLVFPGRDPSMPIGEGAIGAMYARAGFSGRHVPHGWRASFSTIMNELLGEEWRGAIDAALAHAGKDKVEAAYNRAQLLERRRILFDRWGELLTS
jgi:integrase